MMRTLRFIHRWLGIVLALPLLVMGLTGVVLTLEPVWPESGPAPVAGHAPLPANAVLAAAKAATPAGMRPARYFPPEPGAAVLVAFAPEGNPRGPAVFLRLDPGTGKALGPAEPASGAVAWIKRLHQNLLLPQYGGRQIAGWFGVGLLLVTLLGIPLWWPKPGALRAGLTVPREARGLRLNRALHGAAGGWLVVMLVVVSGTGIVQGFPQTVRAVLGLPTGGPPGGPGRGGNRGPGGPVALPDLDGAFRLAEQAVPGMEPRTVILPEGGEPLRIFMAPPGREGAIVSRMVMLDGAGSRILSAQGAPSAAEQTLRWNHDLHEGAGLGPVWRGLLVLSGLALPGFGVTGVAIWLLKRRNRQRMARARRAALGDGQGVALS